MKKVFSLIVIGLLLTTCNDEEVGSRNYPRVRTLAVTDINSTGALLQGEITFSSTDIIEHGFVWNSSSTVSLENAEKVSLGSRSGKGRFEGRIERSLAEGSKYYVKAYARSADYTVYGEVVEFISLGSKAPKPVKIVPEQGTWGETIVIIGENFSVVKRNNVVKFDDVEAIVLSSSIDSLKVVVPDNVSAHQSDVSVSFLGNSNTLEDAFELKLPEISSLSSPAANVGESLTINGQFLRSPNTKVLIGGVAATITSLEKNKIICTVPQGISSEQVTLRVTTGEPPLFTEVPFTINIHKIREISPALAFFGDVVTIKGEHFTSGVSSTTVDFDGVSASILSISATEIQVAVPYTLTVPLCKIGVTCNGVKVFSGEDFRLKAPVITSVSPLIGELNQVITITGENLTNAQVFLNDDSPFTIISSSPTEIQVTLPAEPPLVSQHTAPVKIVVAQQEAVSADQVRIPWIQLPDFPGSALTSVAPVVIGDDAYLLGAEFWQFNGIARTWKNLSKPVEVGSFGFEFALNDVAYFGSYDGSGLWAYSPSANAWTKKKDFPFHSNSWGAVGFVVNNRAFVINGTPLELWEYNDTSDDWSMLPSPSFPLETWAGSFAMGDDFYIIRRDVNELWRFNEPGEAWTKVSTLPFTPDANSNSAFVIGQYAYFINTTDGAYPLPEVWRFDAGNTSWQKDAPYFDPQAYRIKITEGFFSVNQKGYMVSGGRYQLNYWWGWDNNVYEFEPLQN